MEELIKIQSELKAPKGQYNSFGKYRYRSCEDILEAVKPLLAKNGCTLTIHDDIVAVPCHRRIVFQGGGEQDEDARVYVKATCVLTNSEGKTAQTTAFAREEFDKKGMDASQVTGAASSYARKYALNGLFCIDDTKDTDTDEYHNQQQNAPKPQARQQPQAQAVDNEMLQIALSEVRAAQSRQSLEEIFPRYAMLQQDNTFRNEYRKRMNELKQQGLWN